MHNRGNIENINDCWKAVTSAHENSCWRIDLPPEDTAFDDTISDVILHVRYTAREGGNVLRKPARSNLRDIAAAAGPGQARLFCLRHEYPNDWYPFILPVDANLRAQTITPGSAHRTIPVLPNRRFCPPIKASSRDITGSNDLASCA